jgi:hypothetical protein
MAQAIRQFGLKVIGLVSRLLNGAPRAGWQRSTRDPADLAGK